jgi:hypothetical protein
MRDATASHADDARFRYRLLCLPAEPGRWRRGVARLVAGACSFLLVLALSACAAFSGYPERPVSRADEIRQMAPKMSGDAILSCMAARTDDCRNSIVTARMYVTDLQFSTFEETLFRSTREAAFGATLGTLGLTSAAAVASGGTSQALSGTAALVIGGREAFQKEVLAERTVVAIHTAMRARRAQIAARILEGLQRSVDSYPLTLGLRDLNDYYDAGTILGALVGITESVGASAREAEKTLDVTIAYQLDPAGEKLTKHMCTSLTECDTPDAAFVKRMKECWPKAEVAPDTVISQFLHDKSFAGARLQVLGCVER